MSDSSMSLSPGQLAVTIGTPAAPWVVDVRRRAAFEASERRIAGSLWRDHLAAADWAAELPPGPIVVYCVHGHQVSQAAAALLRSSGREARYLAGGFEAFLADGGPTLRRGESAEGGHWVTASPPSCDALACAWLIRRFIDRRGQIHFVEPNWAAQAAEEIGATGFALEPEPSAFDGLRARYDLTAPSLDAMTEGIGHVLGGLLRRHGPGEALLAQSAMVFDAVYAGR